MRLIIRSADSYHNLYAAGTENPVCPVNKFSRKTCFNKTGQARYSPPCLHMSLSPSIHNDVFFMDRYIISVEPEQLWFDLTIHYS